MKVIPDEYTYSFAPRLGSLSGADIPNYLYYGIYRITSLFGREYLNAARVINAILFMLSAPFLHSLARRVCGIRLSLFLTLAVLLSPFAGYTAYYMPESIYFTFFWASIWLLFRFRSLAPWRFGLLCGGLVGLITLLKTHGIFLLPGFAIMMIATTPRDRRRKFFGDLLAAGAAAAAFATVRFGLGYALAGPAGLGLFGIAYGRDAGAGMAAAEPTALAANFLYSLFGHVLYMCVVAGPLLLALLRHVGDNATSPHCRELRDFAVWGASFLIPLVAASALFSALVAPLFANAAIPDIMRVQTRYYTFVYPFLLILVGGAVSAGGDGGRIGPGGIAAGLAVAGLAAYGVATYLRGYLPMYIPDAPEIAAMSFFPEIFYPLAILNIALCLAGMIRPATAGRGWLFLFLPLYLLATIPVGLYIVRESNGLRPNLYDKAGIFVRDHLGGECDWLAVADPGEYAAKKTMMSIDNFRTLPITNLPGRVDPGDVPPDRKWLLVFGGLTVPKEWEDLRLVYEERLPGGGYAGFELFRIADFDFSVDPAEKKPEWPLAAVRVGNRELTADYRIPLPERFFPTLAGEPSAPGTPGNWELVLTGVEKPAVFRWEAGARSPAIDNPEGASGFRLRFLPADGGPATADAMPAALRRVEIGTEQKYRSTLFIKELP